MLRHGGFCKLMVITSADKLPLLYFPKTLHYFHYIFLRNYHSGNTVGQDQEF